MFRHLLKVILTFVKVNQTIRSRPSWWFWDQTHLTWVFRFDWILLLLFKTTVKWIFRWRVSTLILIINRFNIFQIFQLKTFFIITFIFLVDLWHLFIACVISTSTALYWKATEHIYVYLLYWKATEHIYVYSSCDEKKKSPFFFCRHGK